MASGQLAPKVRQAVTFGRDHISHCELCSARGFHCELCSDNEVIYPFQLGNTYTVSITIIMYIYCKKNLFYGCIDYMKCHH